MASLKTLLVGGKSLGGTAGLLGVKASRSAQGQMALQEKYTADARAAAEGVQKEVDANADTYKNKLMSIKAMADAQDRGGPTAIQALTNVMPGGGQGIMGMLRKKMRGISTGLGINV